MQASPLRLPRPETFSGDPYQLPLFLFPIKLRFALDATLEDLPEEEKVFAAIGYLRGRAWECFTTYLGDSLTHEEGHRAKDTDELFGKFQVFEDRLRRLFSPQTAPSGARESGNIYLCGVHRRGSHPGGQACQTSVSGADEPDRGHANAEEKHQGHDSTITTESGFVAPRQSRQRPPMFATPAHLPVYAALA